MTLQFMSPWQLTNDEAPEMQLGILQVQPGTESILGTDTLMVKDMDTPMSQLIFTLTAAPHQGESTQSNISPTDGDEGL